MPTALPAATDFTGASVSEGDFKTALTSLREYLDELLGDTGGQILGPAGTVAAPGISFDADADNGFYRIGANNWAAAAGGSKILELLTTGIGVVGLLDLSAGTSGQIKFPATQNASADANTLDDYEEGTYTPGLSFGGGTTGLLYDVQVATYTKIGNRCYFDAYLQVNSIGSSTGSALFTGLPFTIINTTNGRSTCAISGNGFTIVVTDPRTILLPNTTTISLFNFDTGVATAMTHNSFQASTQLYVSGHFKV